MSDGIKQDIARSIHSHNAFFSAWKIGTTLPVEKECKGPAEEALLKYAAYIKNCSLAQVIRYNKVRRECYAEKNTVFCPRADALH